MRSSFICGLAGATLAAGERSFLAEARPAGIILFARNCETGDQIRRLIAEAVAAIGAETLVLVDQEGGRVQRVRPPIARRLPPAAAFARLYQRDSAAACEAARLAARLAAEDLRALGFTMDCAPVLDVPVAGAHDIIGDRAFGRDPSQVAALGRAVAKGLAAGGIAPVIKHIPGHGRALVDSHLDLPVVHTQRAELSRTDFAPFKALRGEVAAMTAHVVFTAIDPGRPASTSPVLIRDVIRGEIGFDGLLMSDDLGMKALGGSMDGRTRAVMAAGSDLALHCSGDLTEMAAVAGAAPPLEGEARRRFGAAVNISLQRQPFDVSAAEHAIGAAFAALA